MRMSRILCSLQKKEASFPMFWKAETNTVISKLGGAADFWGLLKAVAESSGLSSLLQKFNWNSFTRIISTLIKIII